MKKTIGLLAIMLIALFLGGCTLNNKDKDNINYNNSDNQEDVTEIQNEDNENDEEEKALIEARDEALRVSLENNSKQAAYAAMSLSANAKSLNIVSRESQAKYSLNEILNGVPTFVVGTSNKIEGQIMVDDTVTPAKIKIGDISLDATSFKSDKDLRDKNLINLMLRSNLEENRYIVFKTTEVRGVPETLVKDQSFPIEIIGNLAISGNVKPVTFTGNATWKADNTLAGSVSTDLAYEDFGLYIPDLPFLSNVDKIVKLDINLKTESNK